MNDKLLCPFCGQELVRHWGMKEPALYCCDNPKCSLGGVATESAWQALIDSMKEHDLCHDALVERTKDYDLAIQHSKTMTETCLEYKKKLDMLQEFITKLYLNGNITDEQLHWLKRIKDKDVK